MISAVSGVQPITVRPFSDISTDLNGQSKGLNPNKYNDLLKTLRNKISTEGTVEKKDKETYSKTDFKELASKLKSIVEDDNVSFDFSLDKDTKKIILKLINSTTKEIIQQYPPEISLKIARMVAASLLNNG
jgi:uncharacterized FlaG/YvyC family protein